MEESSPLQAVFKAYVTENPPPKIAENMVQEALHFQVPEHVGD